MTNIIAAVPYRYGARRFGQRRGTGRGGPQSLAGPRAASESNWLIPYCKDGLLVLKFDGAGARQGERTARVNVRATVRTNGARQR